VLIPTYHFFSLVTDPAVDDPLIDTCGRSIAAE
jgi:hypothetical protein